MNLLEVLRKFRKVCCILTYLSWSFVICFIWSFFSGADYPYWFLPLFFILFRVIFNNHYKKV